MSRTPLALLVIATLAVTSCGGDGTVLTTSPTAAAVSTTTGVTTTVTAPITTTTDAATPTAAPATTTTESPLDEPILFLPDGLGVVTFGMAPEDTIATMVQVLGPPTDDTGWVPSFDTFGVCPGPMARQTGWGELFLLFTDDGPFPGGGPQFFSYVYLGGLPGTTPGPPESVDSGTTVDQVLAIWPSAVVTAGDEHFPPSFRVGQRVGEQLYGTLTGASATDTVIDIYGGYGCGE